MKKATKQVLKQVLIWHGKYGNVYWEASTEEQELLAFLAMFKKMDENEFYRYDLVNNQALDEAQEDLEELEGVQSIVEEGKIDPRWTVRDLPGLIKETKREIARIEEQKKLYASAKGGDSKAAKRLCSLRSEYEYEKWDIQLVIQP